MSWRLGLPSCSRNARPRKALVGRAQLKGDQAAARRKGASPINKKTKGDGPLPSPSPLTLRHVPWATPAAITRLILNSLVLSPNSFYRTRSSSNGKRMPNSFLASMYFGCILLENIVNRKVDGAIKARTPNAAARPSPTPTQFP